MDSISKAHEQLLGEGISITDLYIYDCIVNDEYGYGYGDMTVEEKFNKIVEYVGYAVNAAEQIFKETGLGEKKKEYVLNFINGVLGKLNYSITEEELNILIESAVKDMNDAKKLVENASK